MKHYTRKQSLLFISMLGSLFFSASLLATVNIGQPAPVFEGVDSNGQRHSLSDFIGKTVVLEWTNHDCPYVVKYYSSNAMQSLQKQATGDGVIWLSIISSAPGKQGHVSAQDANNLTESRNASPTAVILDEQGEIGKLYGAKTTPHMYIINSKGELVYMGGIDSIASTRTGDIEKAKPYVKTALQQLADGKAISDQVTRPYGCSVKY